MSSSSETHGEGPDTSERSGLLGRVLSLSADERTACLWSFLCFFSILCAYFLLRPVRDEMAVLAGPENIPTLFIGTFVVTLLVVPTFGWLTKRFPRRLLLPATFVFFALNLLVFYGVFGSDRISQVWAARAFFVWLSVFNMFVVSLFWSFMADIYSKDQARRLFGLIMSGGSAGAILGPLATTVLVGQVGIRTLFLVGAGLLMFTVLAIARLLAWSRDRDRGEHPVTEEQPIGGGVLEGIELVLRTPYLAMIAGIFLLGTFAGTALYLYQAQLFAEFIPESQDRTRLFALMDTVINSLNLVLQAFVVRHAIQKLGVAGTLALLPVFSIVVFVAVAVAPSLGLLVVLQVLRRSTNFGFNKPALETLFTVVSAHSKYKAKNFIDVTLVRGADVVSSQSISLAQALVSGFTPVAFFCAGVCAVWGLLALRIGRAYNRYYERRQDADADFVV